VSESRDISKAFRDGAVIDDAVRRAGEAAIREYVRTGMSMPVWRRGRVVWIPAEELESADRDVGRVARRA